MTYVHNLNPIAIEIYNIKIHWYSLAYLFGFLLGSFYAKNLLRKVKSTFKENMVDDFLTYSIIGVILGGRLGYVFFYNLDFYLHNPIHILRLWEGGMSFHGGLIGVVIAMIIYSKIKRVVFFDLANIVAASAPIGILFGRIANFVNSELVGKPTNGQWGVIFDIENNVLRHPSQLYEAFFEGFVIFMLIRLFLLKDSLKSYNPCSIFLISYGIFRFIIEFFREPDHHIGYFLSFFTLGQILCLVMFCLGFLFLRRGRR